MEDELISKKELLELTNISYGQLYRWKRKNLIPEEWFIRKSAVTGQETFFPKGNILARIDKIKNMKEDHSLDDIAEVFSPELSEIVLSRKEIAERGIIPAEIMESIAGHGEESEIISFKKLLSLHVSHQLLQSGDLSIEEARNVAATVESGYGEFEGKGCDVVVLRKFGVSFCFLLVTSSQIHGDKGAKIVARLNLARSVEELTMKM